MINKTRRIRKDVQSILRDDYRSYQIQLSTLPDRIKTEQQRMIAIKSSLTPKSGGGSGNSQQEKSTALIVEIEQLKNSLRIAKREVTLINKILDSLTEQERTALEIMDINREPMAINTLCEALGMEKSGAYDIYDTALDRFGKAYFGTR